MSNEVEVYAQSVNDCYTILRNDLIRNQVPKKLSSVAFRLLSILLSMPEKGWKTSREELANRFFTEGHGQVKKALTELEKAGYFRRTRKRGSSGEFTGWVWQVSDQPIFIQPVDKDVSAGETTGQKPTSGKSSSQDVSAGETTGQKPTSGSPTSGEPTSGSYSLKGTTPPPGKVGEENSTSEPPKPERFEEAAALLSDLPTPWRFGRKTLTTGALEVAAVLRGDQAAAWPVEALRAELVRELPISIKQSVAFLRSRLYDLPINPPSLQATKRHVPWCEKCDERTRMIEDINGNPRHCHCHWRHANGPQVATQAPGASPVTDDPSAIRTAIVEALK